MADRPFYVEEHATKTDYYSGKRVVEYALVNCNDGKMVYGTDVVFMHQLADRLNEEAHGADIHR